MDGLLDATASSAANDSRSLRGSDERTQDLFSGLSQELCRPLISLRAGFDLLLAGSEGPVSVEQHTHVEHLRVQCDELIRLTRSFLDYAVMTRLSQPAKRVPFRLGALLEETNRQFEARAVEHDISWECRLEGDDSTVDIDLDCFQQILARLVDNAFCHTPQGGRAGVVASVGSDTWRVVISDDGIGIPADELERVFEPLVRLGLACNPSPTSAANGSLGMGLAVSRELVRLLNGTIHLESTKETGTRVTICFPHSPSSSL